MLRYVTIVVCIYLRILQYDTIHASSISIQGTIHDLTTTSMAD